MATMFPAENEAFTTAGEETVYRFLRRAARPDAVFLAWYSPDIEDREPDFILLSPDSGLIVLEVKDWLAEQVLEADPKSALLQIGPRRERRKQPLAQAREYVNSLLSLLGRHAPEGAKGKAALPCPITWGAVFPHMRREEFEACGLGEVMDGARVLCWDDLNIEKAQSTAANLECLTAAYNHRDKALNANFKMAQAACEDTANAKECRAKQLKAQRLWIQCKEAMGAPPLRDVRRGHYGYPDCGEFYGGGNEKAGATTCACGVMRSVKTENDVLDHKVIHGDTKTGHEKRAAPLQPLLYLGARSGGRTRTADGREILSLLCLPVPPSGHSG